MKKYLFAGLTTLLPIALTIMIVTWLFDFFTNPFLHLTEHILVTYKDALGIDVEHHKNLVIFISRLFALGLLFLLILGLGVLGRNIFLKYTHLLLLRIPFVKSIYRISKEVTKSLFSQGQTTFKQTVLIPFPHTETHALGFITGEAPPLFKNALPGVELSVFVPTAPHPLSGYILLTSKKSLVEVDVSTEDAFKYLLSCGVITPPATGKKEES